MAKRLIIPKNIGPKGLWGFESLAPKRFLAYDTETTGLDPWGTFGVDRSFYPARAFMFTFCDEEQNTACARFEVNPYTRQVIYDAEILAEIKKYLEDPSLDKVLFNYCYDIKMTRFAGINAKGVMHDVMIRMHVIDPSLPAYKLKPLARQFLGIPSDDETDLKESIASTRRAGKKLGYMLATSETHGGGNKDDSHTMADCWLADHELCRKYGERDALRTMCLFQVQESELNTRFRPGLPSLRDVYNKELELMKALDYSECRGVAIDEPRARELISFYEKQNKKAAAWLRLKLGKDFNPNSSQQKRRLFFGKLGYKPLQYCTKPKTRIYTDCQACKGNGCRICQNTGRNPKCDGDFLASISGVEKAADKLLWQSASKTMLGYAKAYLKHMVLEEGVNIIHPNNNATGTRTGRLSSSNPNLQNVASDEKGGKKTSLPYRLREVFIPRPGFCLYIPDFSQIEVWILALLTGDQKFIDTLAEGGDAHQLVADLVYPNSYDKRLAKKAEDKKAEGKELTAAEAKVLKIKSSLRKQVKAVNFGIIYGQGEEKTATSLGVSKREAAQIIENYHKALPAVKGFMSSTVEDAKMAGCVGSIYGRIYPVERGKEYRATNYLVQGAAADLQKNGMINVHKLSVSDGYRGKLFCLLNIHDELLNEVHLSIDTETTRKKMAEAMSRDYKFLGAPCPFSVGLKISYTRWSETPFSRSY